MEFWQILLYGAAAFLALRSLTTLMEHHKRYHRQQLIRQDREHEEAAARAAAEHKPSKPHGQSNGKAA